MNPRRWTIQDLLKVTSQYLGEKGIESSRLCAEMLLAHQLGVERIDLYLHLDKPLQEGEIEGYRSLIRRRMRGEPVQYITGGQEFWSMNFKVGPGVLIPRPESELLVEQVLLLVKRAQGAEKPGPRILDLGTGCGALVISLAREMKDADLYGSDLSGQALSFALENAGRHGVKSRIGFFQGDLFEPLKSQGFHFDFIVTNPPYVAREEMDTLMPEVGLHEPRVALDGGPGGMNCIRRIIQEGAAYLKPAGWLLVEMDPRQTDAALDLVEDVGCYKERQRFRDYSQRYRVVAAQKA